MQSKMQSIVKGVSYFDGTIDGKQLNSGSVFIEEEMDDKNGNAKGFRTVEHKCSSADVVKRIIHNDFPAKCEIVLDLLVKKGTHSFVVSDIRPISSANPAPKN
jgi:hypothetical protein